MSNKKPTMSHTPAQRKAWHAGKSKLGYNGWIRVINKGNKIGAFTPRSAKRGIFCKPLAGG